MKTRNSENENQNQKNGLEMAHKLSLESVFAGSVWLKTDCTETKIITSIWRHELIQPSELISRY